MNKFSLNIFQITIFLALLSILYLGNGQGISQSFSPYGLRRQLSLGAGSTYNLQGNTARFAGYHKTGYYLESEVNSGISFFQGGSIVNPMTGHTGRLLRAVQSSNESFMISISEGDNDAFLWDLSTYTKSSQFTGHLATIVDIKISSNQQTLITGSLDNSVKIWTISDQSNTATITTGYTQGVTAVAINPNQDKIVTIGNERIVKVWSVASPSSALLTSSAIGSGIASYIEFSPDGNSIVVSVGNEIYVLKTSDLSEEYKITGHTGQVNKAIFTDDGYKIISCSNDNSIKVWNKSELAYTLSKHTNFVNHFEFSKTENKKMLSSSQDGTLQVWTALCDSGQFAKGLATCNACSAECSECYEYEKCHTCTLNSASLPACKCPANQYLDVNTCKNCEFPCLDCSSKNTCTSCYPGDNRQAPAYGCGCISGYQLDQSQQCVKSSTGGGDPNNSTPGTGTDQEGSTGGSNNNNNNNGGSNNNDSPDDGVENPGPFEKYPWLKMAFIIAGIVLAVCLILACVCCVCKKPKQSVFVEYINKNQQQQQQKQKQQQQQQQQQDQNESLEMSSQQLNQSQQSLQQQNTLNRQKTVSRRNTQSLGVVQ